MGEYDRLAEQEAAHIEQIRQPDLLDVALRTGKKIAGLDQNRADKAPNNKSSANVRHQSPDRHIENLRIDKSQGDDSDRHIRRRPERSQGRAPISVEDVVPAEPDPKRPEPRGARKIGDREI